MIVDFLGFSSDVWSFKVYCFSPAQSRYWGFLEREFFTSSSFLVSRRRDTSKGIVLLERHTYSIPELSNSPT